MDGRDSVDSGCAGASEDRDLATCRADTRLAFHIAETFIERAIPQQ